MTESSNGNPVAAFLARLRIGAPQSYRDIVVWPLSLPGDEGPSYQTLEEALSTNQARVTEISEGGSVPQLRVHNLARENLLIVDGEELIGAKQNRAVNTSMLLPGNSETVIPVSCTEQGRWRNVSAEFSSSNAFMEMKLRHSKMRSVSDRLKRGEGHSSDQEQVWDKIKELQCKAQHHSPTNAMSEVFEARRQDTQEALAAFVCQAGQHGLLVAIRGRVAGCDTVSRSATYARLHSKLIRSYVLDALLENPRAAGSLDERQAPMFLESIAKCRAERFPSVGLGESLRLQNGETSGAALACEQSVVHLAAFRSEPGEPEAGMSPKMLSLSHRRRHFRGVSGA